MPSPTALATMEALRTPYGPYTQSQVSTWVDFGEDQAISFRFRVSCQDAEETDYFALFVGPGPRWGLVRRGGLDNLLLPGLYW